MPRLLTTSLAVLVVCLLVVVPAGAAETFLNNGVTAHRGDSGSFPENTMPAFQSGIDLGADWLELDLFRTADGVLVVTHDRMTGRVAERDLNVLTSTLADIQALDVATGFRKQKGKTLQEVPRQTMPTLEQVLQLVISQNRTRVSLQPKMDCVPDAIQIIRKLKAERWVGFNDGNFKLMSLVKELAPEIPVFWDRPGNSDLSVDLPIAREMKFEAIVVHHSGLNAERIASIQSAGFEAGAWTVNDEPTMTRLLNQGITRIYTDEPALLLKLKRERLSTAP